MAERRRYSRHQKAAIVGAAEVSGVRAAARDAGIPVSTLESWRQRGEFAQLRTEKREEVAQDLWATFQLAVHRTAELIPLTDDVQKVATTAAIIYDKFALINGSPTARTETRSLPPLDDHEARALRDALDRVKAEELV